MSLLAGTLAILASSTGAVVGLEANAQTPLHSWTRNSSNLVINPSTYRLRPSNSYGFNTADPCVFFDQNTQEWHAYFSSYDWAEDYQVIKHASSSNGVNWVVDAGAALALGAPGGWDSKSVETCSAHSVEVSPGVFVYYLFYSATATTGGDADIYSIGMAFSDNPNQFYRLPAGDSPKQVEGLLFDVHDAFPANSAVASGIVTDPDLVVANGVFLMWYYCAAADAEGNYFDGGICFAMSFDGINFTQFGSVPSLLNDQAVGLVAQQPSVVYNSQTGRYEMWLVIDDPAYASYGVPGLAVGGYYHATSTDLWNWTYTSKTRYSFAWNAALPYENRGLANGADVVLHGGRYWLFYPSFTTQGIPSDYFAPFTWGLNVAHRRQ